MFREENDRPSPVPSSPNPSRSAPSISRLCILPLMIKVPFPFPFPSAVKSILSTDTRLIPEPASSYSTADFSRYWYLEIPSSSTSFPNRTRQLPSGLFCAIDFASNMRFTRSSEILVKKLILPPSMTILISRVR